VPASIQEISSVAGRDKFCAALILTTLGEQRPPIDVENLHIDAGTGLLVIAQLALRDVFALPELPELRAWYCLSRRRLSIRLEEGFVVHSADPGASM